MTAKKTPFERIEVKAARGDYTLVEPLDLIILESLPNEGTLFVGLYPLGETAGNISKAKLEGKIPVSVVARRLGTLRQQGLVVKKQAIGQGANEKNVVWQRTPAAVALLASKEGKNGSSNKKSG
jgi:hypothetical protein